MFVWVGLLIRLGCLCFIWILVCCLAAWTWVNWLLGCVLGTDVLFLFVGCLLLLVELCFG